ncbi:ATP-binding protein [Spirosoma pollinicola]|nr:ATP-binding protein [Spirosoma pollinicola]
MPSTSIPTHSDRAAWARLVGGLLLILCLTTVYAQHTPSAVSLVDIPNGGFLLQTGWRFQPGDNPNGAVPLLDDSRWRSIDPTLDIRKLPQLQQAGIGWLRLHLTTGPSLPPIMVTVFQSIASEVYVDGQLLYRFGTISTNPDSVQAYNPCAGFNLPLKPSSQHLVAIRFACQANLHYDNKFLPWDAAALQMRLFSPTALLTLHPISLQASYMDTFRVGIAFILFILHLSLFFAYRTQRANLYAASMYLMLLLAFLAKASNGFVHSINARMVVYYVSLLDTLVSSAVIFTLYSLFNFRKEWFFWLAFASSAFRFVPLSANYQWLYIAVTYYINIQLAWLFSVAPNQRKLVGAGIVRVGVLVNLAILPVFSLLSALNFTAGEHEWVYHILYMVAFLCIPLTLSLRLALEHGWVNRQLMARLQDVETLSARNLAQQQEKQQLLAEQNEQLELQVADRTRELNQKADQLREMDVVKSRFFSNITHEFRTPLSLILSPVEKLLQENRFDRPTLTLVHRNADQLLRLINQLLDLSKLEGNYMNVALMQGEVTGFIDHVVTLFRRPAEQKGVTLTYTVDQFPDQSYIFDADKWEKILTNLIANALKFTPSGGTVTLTLAPVWVGVEMNGIQIKLADSGIGIAADQLPHIFDRFYQVDNSSTRAYGGTGIGLALVNELVGLLGGTITVESQLGAGTTFYLTLPVKVMSSTTSDVPKISWSVPKSSSVDHSISSLDARISQPAIQEYLVPRVLIVEDNAELREFLVAELADVYDVIQAVDGQAGWVLIQTELPDIVLTDVMMPQMDGYELTRLIKNNPDTNHIAVVMLTAKTAQQSRIDGLRQGADDYLTKPFNINELHLRLHNLITRQQKLGAYFRQQFALPTGSPVSGQPESQPSAAVVDSFGMDSLAPDSFLLRIYSLLDQYLDDPTISVDWLADQLNMNRKTLYRKVQSLIQLAPADLIRQYRLRKAAEFLRAGYNVTETADLVGFNTPSYFTTVFKEFYLQTPSEFIASHEKSA